MFSRIFTYSIKNIFRNTFLSISSVLVITLLMFFINILLVIQNVSFNIIDTVNDKWTIELYLKEKYDKNSVEVVALIDWIKKISETVNVNYKDKDDALELMRTREPDLVKIIETQNPLPNSIRISNVWIWEYWSVNYLVQSKLYLFDWSKEDSDFKENSLLESSSEKSKFSDYDKQYNSIIWIVEYLVVLRVALYIIIWMFLFSVAVILYSVIGNFIYHYKDEIYITRLVWWSKMFIYWPFWIQWILYALAWAIFWIILFVSSLNVVSIMLNKGYDLSFVLWEYQLLFLLEVLVLMLIGGISGLVSSRKYLNNN